MKYFSVAFVSIFSKTVFWNNYVLSYKDKNEKSSFFLMFTPNKSIWQCKNYWIVTKNVYMESYSVWSCGYWTIFAIQIQTYSTNKSLSIPHPLQINSFELWCPRESYLTMTHIYLKPLITVLLIFTATKCVPTCQTCVLSPGFQLFLLFSAILRK